MVKVYYKIFMPFEVGFRRSYASSCSTILAEYYWPNFVSQTSNLYRNIDSIRILLEKSSVVNMTSEKPFNRLKSEVVFLLTFNLTKYILTQYNPIF